MIVRHVFLLLSTMLSITIAFMPAVQSLTKQLAQLLTRNEVCAAKTRLLDYVAPLNRGVDVPPGQAAEVESLIDQLVEAAGIPPAFAESPLINANWELKVR